MISESPEKISALKSAPLWLSEKKVMGRLGLNRDDIRSIRQEMLIAGEDFREGDNRLIELSASGIEKIEKNIGLLGGVMVAKLQSQKNAAIGSGRFEGCSGPAPCAPTLPGQNPAVTHALPFVDPARLIAWPRLKTPQRMTVVWARSANRRALMCVYEGTKDTGSNRLTVQVRDNSNFTPGMVVLALHESGTIWSFAGNPAAPAGSAPRMPRNRGRW